MRWMASLFRMGLVSVIVCLVSVATTWYTVSYYVDDLLSQFHITTPKQKQELSQIITSLVKQTGLIDSRGSADSSQGGKTGAGTDGGADKPPFAIGQTGAAKEPAADSSPVAGNGPTAGNPTASSPTASSPAAGTGDDAVSVWSQTDANGSSIDQAGKQGAGSKMVISAQDFYTEKEKLSDDDKMKVFTILVENLPPDQLQQISQLVEDGITETELQKIDGILRQYVSSTDYEVLMNILDKL